MMAPPLPPLFGFNDKHAFEFMTEVSPLSARLLATGWFMLSPVLTP